MVAFARFLAGVALTGAAAAADYTFAGRVVDDTTSAPLANANVTLFRASPIGPLTEMSAITTPDGSFSVSSNTAGTFDVTVTHSGHVTRSHIPLGAYASPTTVNDVEIRLVAAGALSVHVAASGSGLPLANVRLVSEGNATRQTNGSGNATYSGLTPGEFRVCVIDFQSEYLSSCVAGHSLGFSTTLGGPAVSVLPGQTTTVELSLQPGGVIAGRIDDALADAPLPNAAVNFSLHDAAGAVLRSPTRTTDATGGYRIVGVPAGSFTLTAQRSAPPHLARELYPELACDATTCPYGLGELISVTAGATTSEIDFTESPRESRRLVGVSHAALANSVCCR